MHLYTPYMTVGDSLCQGLGGEVLSALPRIKLSAAEIHGVGAILYRGTQGLHRPGRC